MLADFQIGVDLARGDLKAVENGIANLRKMPDDDGKSEIRQAQLLMRRHEYKQAVAILDRLLSENGKSRFQIRSLRAVAAARNGNFDAARRDVEFVRGLPGRQTAARRLEASVLAEQGKLKEAEEIVNSMGSKVAEDWLLQARIFELRADAISTGLEERNALKQKAAELRVKYNFASEHDYEE